jgi:hypothetical protein
MKRPLLFAGLITLLALPLVAQTAEFGLLVGGSKRMNDVAGTQGQSGIKDFKFSNSVKEAYYATQLDPDSWFSIKVGQVDLPLIYSNGKDAGGNLLPPTVIKGKIEHIDALVDYRFSEPFGSSGFFGGVGMYRAQANGQADDTNFGLSAGVNVDLPMTRRYGFIAEAAYHWVHTDNRQRFVTLTGGLRISF